MRKGAINTHRSVWGIDLTGERTEVGDAETGEHSDSAAISSSYSGWLWSLGCLWIGGELLGGLGVTGAPHSNVVKLFSQGMPFLSSALLGAYLIFLTTTQDKRTKWLVTGLGIAFEVLL